MTKGTSYIAITADGRYGLAADHTLYAIVTGPEPADWDADLLGAWGDYPVGAVWDAENIEVAADAADEELRCLTAQARDEFGY